MDEMKKYIIEFSEDPCTIRLLKIKNGNECPTTEFKTVTPYKELDLEAIRNEAYEDGYKTAKVQCNIQTEKDMREVGERHYQKGLSDAWEAARKIAKLDTDEQKRLFGCFGIYFVAHEFSAYEAIEKIRQYEQEKEEFHLGDEICHKTTPEIKVCITNLYEDGNWDGFTVDHYDVENIGKVYSNRSIEDWVKTGKHYSQIAEVLHKINKKE